MALVLRELAAQVGAELVGDPDGLIARVATLQDAGPDAVTFLANPAYRRYLTSTKAGVVILRREDLEQCPVAALVTDNPYAAYARAAAALNPAPAVTGGIHPTAVLGANTRVDASACIGPQCAIEDEVHIGPGVYVGPGCVIGSASEIGAGTRLVANVTVCHGSVIGCNVLVHPGVVIGSDGFGIANEGGRWIKVPQLGRVRIGDQVEIGANTTIDRGAIGDTVLEEGVKLDNQIQIAHNVWIGAHTAIAGCVGIAGSARIGRHCAIGGGAGVLGHLEIADHVQVTAMSLVTRSIHESGVYSSGTPLQPNEQWRKNFAHFRRLDDMARRLRALEKKINAE